MEGTGKRKNVQQNNQAQRFLVPLSECEYTLTSILEELQGDPWPVVEGNRPTRCTGAAINVAVGLLENCYPMTGARIMTFLGGACTIGPGQMAGASLKEPIRVWKDLDNDRSKYTKKSTKFYESITARLVKNGHIMDMFNASVDQSGVYEMRSCIERSGGLFVVTDEFTSEIFTKSWEQVFEVDLEGNLKMAFGGVMNVQTCREFKVCGAIGPVASMEYKGSSLSETEIGIGGTTAWKINGLDANTTVAVYYEVINSHDQPISTPGLVQFTTQYQHSSGQYRTRVTTVAHGWAPNNSQLSQLQVGFDQEAATALMARVAVHKTINEDPYEVQRWLDRMLIRLMKKFANYRKDDPQSFDLVDQFKYYPQFMFHLRRSQFLKVFNDSPDQTAFVRCILNKENTTNSVVMIQPQLTSYSFDGPPVPVFLDVTSVQKDKILLLDTFFQVVVFHGQQIASWRNQGFQEKPNYENFKLLLAAPLNDAEELMAGRFPTPRYVVCDQYKSQARFLTARLNPSVTHNNQNGLTQDSGHYIVTDDVSLQVFEDHLKNLVVQSQ
eukprot:TRINITY_DN707_c0_g1_i3.p1 TRINITY_DN707_c0_g1~~TRINITY_DN707_c0_g1_i3.p1  ORF type:complete len:553 (+),score=190.87 TRINITY_DN707_c0_g1_i3:748-2406(+)